MRRMVLVLLTVAASAAPALAQEPLPATDIPATQVQSFLKALPRNAISDLPIRAVDVGGYKVGVYGVFRPKNEPGDAIAHNTRTTEIYYILDGGGTLVTGGKITNPKPPPAGRNPGPRGECDVGTGEDAPQFSKRRERHHRIAYPVRRADHYCP